MKFRLDVVVAGLLGALGINGCSTGSLFDSESAVPSSYVLAPLPPARGQAAPSRASTVDISVARPDVSPGLDSRRIAVLRGRQLDHYKGSEWGASVTEVMQTLLVSSLDQQQLFRSVTSEQTRVSAEYLLDVEVRDFQSEYGAAGGNPQVRVTLISRVIRMVDRALVATINSTALHPADDNRMSAVVAAFEAATHKVALDLTGKAAAAIAADQENKPENRDRRKAG